MTPAGALDVLDEGDSELAEWLFSTSLADELWNEIAQALLPSSWRDVLCQADGAGPTDLLIVPDGPIGSLPLAALPVKDGMPLVDFAAVALVPALSMLGLPDGQHDRAPDTAPTAVVHLDDRKNSLAQVVREAEHWRAAAQRMQVIETADQAALEAALNGRSRPDIPRSRRMALRVRHWATPRAAPSAQPSICVTVRSCQPRPRCGYRGQPPSSWGPAGSARPPSRQGASPSAFPWPVCCGEPRPLSAAWHPSRMTKQRTSYAG